MSQATDTNPTASPPAAQASRGHHPPHLAHHFDTPRQQFDSAKVGMWVFLATEILMFGGLFCAYAVWRGNHPEVFAYGHTHLNWELGAINTILLITSSFTMAWAVRAAQLGARRLLVGLLLVTILGGCGFLVVKTIEYSAKYEHGLWVGPWNQFHPQYEGPAHTEPHAGDAGHAVEHDASGADSATSAAPDASPMDNAPTPGPEHSLIAPAPAGPAGLTDAFTTVGPHAGRQPDAHRTVAFEDLPPYVQARTHQFFQIYFLMTGLHTLHVIIGLGLMVWILVKSLRGVFSPAYFTPVDMVGLYWHLVDLIWIFLFPVLYLIH